VEDGCATTWPATEVEASCA